MRTLQLCQHACSLQRLLTLASSTHQPRLKVAILAALAMLAYTYTYADGTAGGRFDYYYGGGGGHEEVPAGTVAAKMSMCGCTRRVPAAAREGTNSKREDADYGGGGGGGVVLRRTSCGEDAFQRGGWAEGGGLQLL